MFRVKEPDCPKTLRLDLLDDDCTHGTEFAFESEPFADLWDDFL